MDVKVTALREKQVWQYQVCFFALCMVLNEASVLLCVLFEFG